MISPAAESLPTITVPRCYEEEAFTGKRVLGRGGEAVVWVGYFGEQLLAFKKMNTFVTLKTSDSKESFEEFVTLVKCPTHQNIIKVHGLLYDSDICVGYVMEYLQYGSLYNIIYNPANNYTKGEIVEWVRQIALGLQHLHKHGIIHRDVNPKNILVVNLYHLKLADFGMSRRVTSASDSTRPMMTTVGTEAYTAPEVLAEGIHYTYSADIFSLGITIWAITHREKPELQQSTVIYPGKVDDDLSDLMQRCRAEPSTRPTAGDVVQDAAKINSELDAIDVFGPDTVPLLPAEESKNIRPYNGKGGHTAVVINDGELLQRLFIRNADDKFVKPSGYEKSVTANIMKGALTIIGKVARMVVAVPLSVLLLVLWLILKAVCMIGYPIFVVLKWVKPLTWIRIFIFYLFFADLLFLSPLYVDQLVAISSHGQLISTIMSLAFALCICNFLIYLCHFCMNCGKVWIRVTISLHVINILLVCAVSIIVLPNLHVISFQFLFTCLYLYGDLVLGSIASILCKHLDI